MQRQCDVKVESIRKWGPERAAKVRHRITQLSAAPNLAEMLTLPGADCHALSGERSGQYAVDAKHPFRLVFKPCHKVPTLPGGGLDLSKVVDIKIIEVVDYHGR